MLSIDPGIGILEPGDVHVRDGQIVGVGTGLDAPGAEVIAAEGMIVMPGLVDMHGHIGGAEQGTPATYVYKLWMGHGITTVRDPGCGNGIEWCASETRRSERNEKHRRQITEAKPEDEKRRIRQARHRIADADEGEKKIFSPTVSADDDPERHSDQCGEQECHE